MRRFFLLFSFWLFCIPGWSADFSLPQLKDSLENIFLTTGTGELLRHLRKEAEAGTNLSFLRKLVLEENQGKPELIPVSIHPQALPRVTAANDLLKKSGIDFYEFQARFDEKATPPELPEPSEKDLYRKWKITRTVVVPLLGFAGTVAESFFKHGADSGLPAASLARAFATFGLELQFALFNHHWVKLWMKNKPLIPQTRLTEMSRLLSLCVDKLQFIKQSHLWNYIVNWGYTLILYSAGVAGHAISTQSTPQFQALKLITDSFVLNTAFYLSFGISQSALANLSTKGEISELLRFQIETVSSKWNSVWRIVSLVPGLKTLGLAMQLSFGGLVTAPLLLKLMGSQSYAKETAWLFAQNEGAVKAMPSLCERTLSSFYEQIPLRRRVGLWDWLLKTQRP